jgi:hypothetical protein
MGITKEQNRNSKSVEITDNEYKLFQSMKEDKWKFDWNAIKDSMNPHLVTGKRKRDAALELENNDALMDNTGLPMDVIVEDGYNKMSWIVREKAISLCKTETIKKYCEDIGGLGYFTNLNLVRQLDVSNMVDESTEAEQVDNFDDDDDDIKSFNLASVKDVSNMASVKDEVSYSVLERIFSDDFKTVILMCRAELNIFEKQMVSKAKAAKAAKENPKDINYSTAIDDNYNSDMIMCPILMHVIMGILLSQTNNKLVNTKQNAVHVNKKLILEKLNDNNSTDVPEEPETFIVSLIQYASVGLDLLKNNIAMHSRRDKKPAANLIRRVLKKKKLQADIILHIICNVRSGGQVPLFWLNEISGICRDGGIGQKAMNQLSAIGLTKSYTKIKAIDGIELNSFWSLNYVKLQECIARFDIYTSPVTGVTIEIPENIDNDDIDNSSSSRDGVKLGHSTSPQDQIAFNKMYKKASETRTQMLRFNPLGKDYKYVVMMAQKWYRHLIYDYAQMPAPSDNASEVIFAYNDIKSCCNAESANYDIYNMYFDKFDVYLKGLESEVALEESTAGPMIEVYKVDNILKKFLDQCTIKDLRPLIQLKKPKKGDPYYDIYNSIKGKDGQGLASAPSKMLKNQMDQCIMGCLLYDNDKIEDESQQKSLEDLILEVKSWGMECVPKITDWPSVEEGEMKTVRTKSDNLQQYLGPNMPPPEVCLNMIGEMIWNPDNTFPITSEMVAISENQLSSRKVREAYSTKKMEETVYTSRAELDKSFKSSVVANDPQPDNAVDELFNSLESS